MHELLIQVTHVLAGIVLLIATGFNVLSVLRDDANEERPWYWACPIMMLMAEFYRFMSGMMLGVVLGPTLVTAMTGLSFALTIYIVSQKNKHYG
jgi:hypothetical protein